MTRLEVALDNPTTVENVRKMATAVLHHVEHNDIGQALASLNELAELRDQCLYKEIGHLTRELHESIKSLDVQTQSQDDSHTINKLAYIVEMTDRSANKTMDLVDAGPPVINELNESAAELMEKWQRFKNKEMSIDEFKKMSQEIDGFLNLSVNHSSAIKGYFSDIVLAQDYQDLTGQVIHKVTDLIADVEKQLVKMVAMAGTVDKITGNHHDETAAHSNPTKSGLDEKAEGPSINTPNADVVNNQDDVDDLLSSLGF
jgi:chemotaxis protein CheZ